MHGNAACVARLLEDKGGHATINMQMKRKCLSSWDGYTALHWACVYACWPNKAQIVELLLGAGADTTITDEHAYTAEDLLRRNSECPPAAFALVAQVPDSRRAAMLVHARRLVAVSSHALPLTQPAAKPRGGQGATLRRVELTPLLAVAGGGGEGGRGGEEGAAAAAAAAVVVVGGGGIEGEGGGEATAAAAAAAAAAVRDELVGAANKGGGGMEEMEEARSSSRRRRKRRRGRRSSGRRAWRRVCRR